MLHEKSDSSIGQIQCHLFGSFEDMKKSDVSNYWHLTLSILVVLDDGIWNFISISLILHEIFIWWTSFHFHIYTCTTIRVAERKMITSNCVYVDDLVFSILSKNIRFFFLLVPNTIQFYVVKKPTSCSRVVIKQIEEKWTLHNFEYLFQI